MPTTVSNQEILKDAKKPFYFMIRPQGVTLIHILPMADKHPDMDPTQIEMSISTHFLSTYAIMTLSIRNRTRQTYWEDVEWDFDPMAPVDGRILDRLAKTFAIRIEFYSSDKKLLTHFTLTAPQEENVALGRKRARQHIGNIPEPQRSAARARELLNSPQYDKQGKKEHPFHADAYGDLKNPEDATLAVNIVSYWSEKKNYDYLVLKKSFSARHFSEIQKRVLSVALEYGLWFADPLKKTAMELNLLTSMHEIVKKLILNFRKNILVGHMQDLDPIEIHENWENLRRDCEQFNIPIDRQTARLIEDAKKEADEAEAESIDAEVLEESVRPTPVAPPMTAPVMPPVIPPAAPPTAAPVMTPVTTMPPAVTAPSQGAVSPADKKAVTVPQPSMKPEPTPVKGVEKETKPSKQAPEEEVVSTSTEKKTDMTNRSDTELRAFLRVPEKQKEAAVELCKRHVVSALPEIFSIMPKLKPADIIEIFTVIIFFEDDIYPHRVAGLNSNKFMFAINNPH